MISRFLPANAFVLDVGAGDGEMLIDILKQLGANSCGIGMNIQPRLIKLAKKRARDMRAEFVVGDAESLPFKPSVFTVVWYAATVSYLQNVNTAVNEIARITGNQGKVIFTIENPTLEPLRRILTVLHLKFREKYKTQLDPQKLMAFVRNTGIRLVSTERFMAVPPNLHNLEKLESRIPSFLMLNNSRSCRL